MPTPRFASGLSVPTSAPREVDVSRNEKRTGDVLCVTVEPLPPPANAPAHPFELEALNRRLETACLLLCDAGVDEMCVWACACFLADGS